MSEITTYPGGEFDEDLYSELDELPERARRKLLTRPVVALLLVLFAASGFIGGVLVQKGQQTSGSGASGLSGLASRFPAVSGSPSSGSSGSSGLGRGSGVAGLFGGSSSGGAVGTVASISGNTIYVTETSGNTVAVVTTPESKVTKSESVGRHAIRPGDDVVVAGITGSNGKITANSLTDSGDSGTTSSTPTSSSSSGGVSSLFGG